MSAEIFFLILGLATALGAAGFFAWDQHRRCIELIEGSLGKYHATDVDIKRNWMDYDRDTFTYDVTFRDRSGKLNSNRCKVTTRADQADDAVYWSEPLAPPATQDGRNPLRLGPFD